MKGTIVVDSLVPIENGVVMCAPGVSPLPQGACVCLCGEQCQCGCDIIFTASVKTKGVAGPGDACVCACMYFRERAVLPYLTV